jgi:hypothetical protein
MYKTRNLRKTQEFFHSFRYTTKDQEKIEKIYYGATHKGFPIMEAFVQLHKMLSNSCSKK